MDVNVFTSDIYADGLLIENTSTGSSPGRRGQDGWPKTR